MGNHRQTVRDCTDKDPNVEELMKMATSRNAVITIHVPWSPEGAAALGRLVFVEPTIPTGRITSPAEQLPNLSKKLSKLGLPVRLVNCLGKAGLTYLWQVAEKSKAELLKIKGFGSMSLYKVERVLEGLGLGLGMDLSSIKSQPPTRT